MADGFEPAQLVPDLPVARLHGPYVAFARMQRSLLYGTIVAITWLVPVVAIALVIAMS